MKIPVAATEGKTVEISDALFTTGARPELLAQAVRTAQANRRLSPAHTKTRGQVSGGGRKPWRQKGTGRARVGSSRNPIWRGGGVVFGPSSDANHSLGMPARMRRAAFLGALAAAWEDGRVMVISDLALPAPSTKGLLTALSAAGVEPRRTLVVIGGTDESLLRSADNLPDFDMMTVERLGVLEILSAARIVFTESALNKLDARYQPKEKAVR